MQKNKDLNFQNRLSSVPLIQQPIHYCRIAIKSKFKRIFFYTPKRNHLQQIESIENKIHVPLS